jgi:hypothetical protein
VPEGGGDPVRDLDPGADRDVGVPVRLGRGADDDGRGVEPLDDDVGEDVALVDADVDAGGGAGAGARLTSTAA